MVTLIAPPPAVAVTISSASLAWASASCCCIFCSCAIIPPPPICGPLLKPFAIKLSYLSSARNYMRSVLNLHIHNLTTMLDSSCNHSILRHVRWNSAFDVRHHTAHIHLHVKFILDQFLNDFN